MDYIQAVAQVACIFCQHANARESDRCAQCGRTLTHHGSAPSSTFSVIERQGIEDPGDWAPGLTKIFAILDQAVEAWQDGVLDDEGLLEEVEQLEHQLQEHEKETYKQAQAIENAPLAAREALCDGLEMTQQALSASLAGLDLMRAGFAEVNLEFVSQGFEEFETASELMIRAYHAARQAATLARGGVAKA